MKASTPIVPSLGLNAVRLSLLSGAVTAALGAPAMAQESMEIELDPFEHTVFVPGEDTRDVLVTGVKTATITAGFNNVLIAPRVKQETTFRLQGFGVSNALTGVSLVLPAGKGPVNVLASGGTTTISGTSPDSAGWSSPMPTRTSEAPSMSSTSVRSRTSLLWPSTTANQATGLR